MTCYRLVILPSILVVLVVSLLFLLRALLALVVIAVNSSKVARAISVYSLVLYVKTFLSGSRLGLATSSYL